MTKRDLIEKLKDLPDDTIIYIPEYDDERICDIVAQGVDIECDGSDGCQAEVLIH